MLEPLDVSQVKTHMSGGIAAIDKQYESKGNGAKEPSVF